MNDKLIVENITVDTATRRVVDNISLEVSPGKIVSMLGPNGAGKSELVLAIAGVMAFKGDVSIGSRNLNIVGVDGVRAAGIAAVPEGHQVLTGMSVMDNLRASGPMLNAVELEQEVDKVLEVFPELKVLSANKAGSLSGGQQQMVAIAQALVSRPKFLLIDEMSLGLAPVVIERLVGVVRNLKAQGIGILLIEQFTQLALSLADHCYVMAQGQLQFSGPPSTLLEDRSILEKAYLGS